MAPGDVLRLTLANELDQTTNLHTHGLHVSPEGNGDNVFRMVEPGERATYEYVVPTDHPTGTFWYHPHHHGTVADQVFGGLFGALVVAAPCAVGGRCGARAGPRPERHHADRLTARSLRSAPAT